MQKGESQKETQNKGTLYVCATPIGNLEDASFRLVKVLKEVDIIAAEDTRTVRKLLNRYQISPKNIISFHEHSGKAKVEYICQKLIEGKNIALVSESGTPVIQDPGYEVVAESIRRDIPLTIIPGPNAAIGALAISGLPADCFLFVGFLPKSPSKRKNKLQELSSLPYTLIFYESPSRIEKLLTEIKETMGDRKACLVRELTKIYEEATRGRVSEILSGVRGKKIKIKGEIVLVVDGFRGELIKNFTEDDIKGEILNLISQGISKKNALKVISSKYDIDRQTLYNISTKI